MKNAISFSAEKKMQLPGWLSEWSVNQRTSAIRFYVAQRNLLARPFRKITGKFRVYEGFMQTNTEDFSGSTIHLIIEADSIYTGNKRRDKHLLSAGFFDVEQFPFLRFRGVSFEKGRDNKYIIEGDLIIRGCRKRVVIDVTKRETETETGESKVCFQSEFQIDRHDFGFHSNVFFETLIEKQITVQLDLEFSRMPGNIY